MSGAYRFLTVRTDGSRSIVVWSGSNWYEQAREGAGRRWCLQEDSGRPSERLLQAIWLHQRLRRTELRTTDGRRLEVIHPGFPQAEGGPDFHNALIRWEGGTAVEGDVEVDVEERAWQFHGHVRNPRFQGVILRVVWESSAPVAPGSHAGSIYAAAAPPVLALREWLDAPLHELMLWLDGGAALAWPEALRGACCAPLGQLSLDGLVALLQQAGAARFEAKALAFQARARAVGWEQALWEGLFQGLGYKHNPWPMRWIAERKVRWFEEGAALECLEARLLGVSGLLPEETRGMSAEAVRLWRRLWDAWWRDRAALEDCRLPRSAWRLHGVRPANHPERRLILAAHWLHRPGWSRQLEQWCTQEPVDGPFVHSLLKLMEPDSDSFWCRHWTLRSARLSRRQGLIGLARVTDLAINVILPWLAARAQAAGHRQLWERILGRYFAWPASEDNSLLRLARQRLLGGRPLRGPLARAYVQQGLVQIVRDFCDRANARCEGCGFPAAVEAWRRQAAVP